MKDVSLDLKDRALSAAAEGITISDPTLPDNPLIYANSGFESLTGYSAKSVLGKNCRFLQGPDTDVTTVETIRKAIAEEVECTVEILNYRKDGTKFWNRLSITPVRDAAGKLTNFIGVQSDITARREAEDRLRVANSKMKNDLISAARVQQSMLPQQLPEDGRFQFAWRYRPCEELAGDTLNCFRLDDRRIALYILDVSGHGVAASLLSVTLNRMLLPIPGQSILYSPTSGSLSKREVALPTQVAERLNLQFQMDDGTGQFFTMVYGVLNTETSEFDYVSAGHPPLILLNASGNARMLRREQFPIGVMPDIEFEGDSIQLADGDRLFIYTDGIIEAFDENREQFGIERLCRTVEAAARQGLGTVVDNVIDAVDKFCHDSEVGDDVSILGIEASRR